MSDLSAENISSIWSIGLPLARISGFHFFGGGPQISKVKVRNCTPPGGMGPPEPNFGIKIESWELRIYIILILLF